jgi:hypothetical protein
MSVDPITDFLVLILLYLEFLPGSKTGAKMSYLRIDVMKPKLSVF